MGTTQEQPAATRTLTWLHLSDLHTCKPKTGWDAHRVLVPLLKDLGKMQKQGLHPDLLFFTGDLAFGQIGSGKGESIRDQFDDGQAFLESVRTAFSPAVPRENVFLVPGNHDVNRDEVTDDQTAWLDKQTEEDVITNLLQKKTKQWRRYMERLKDYREFLERYGYAHLLADPDRLIYTAQRTFHDVEVGIAGLNSSWSCCRESPIEKGHLWLGGDWQLGELTGRVKNTALRIALIHHPLNWFVEVEDSSLWNEIAREFTFCLHGHEHQGWVNILEDGHFRVAAAACYERSKKENGYNFVRLNLDTGAGEVWMRRFDKTGGGWIRREVSDKTNNEGVWPLRLAPLPPTATPASSPVNP